MEEFSTPSGFQEVEHTADVSLVVIGFTLEELFIHAARGMYFAMGATTDKGSENLITLDLREPDHESLLVSFLSELLYLAEKRLMARDLHLDISGLRLTGTLVMVPLQNMRTEIKAVTYNNLRIHRYDRNYRTQLVFDI